MAGRTKAITAATKTKLLQFVETLGDKIFVGAAAVYIADKGNVSTIQDLKAIAIAGVLAGVVWAFGAATKNQ